MLVGGYSVKPILVRVEAWQVESARGSDKFHGLELIVQHDLANSCVHGLALILCFPSVVSCLNVGETKSG